MGRKMYKKIKRSRRYNEYSKNKNGRMPNSKMNYKLIRYNY